MVHTATHSRPPMLLLGDFKWWHILPVIFFSTLLLKVKVIFNQDICVKNNIPFKFRSDILITVCYVPVPGISKKYIIGTEGSILSKIWSQFTPVTFIQAFFYAIFWVPSSALFPM